MRFAPIAERKSIPQRLRILPTYAVRVGTLKQRAQLAPRSQIWFRSALPWTSDLRDVLQIERQ